MTTGAWLAILAGLGLVGYVVYSRSRSTGTGLACPDPTSETFKQILAKVGSGETSPKTAETMARGYDNAGCPVAAAAIRGAVSVAPVGSLAEAPRKLLVDYRLSAEDAAGSVDSFATKAGFGSAAELLSANPSLAAYAPPSGWPPDAPMTYRSRAVGGLDEGSARYAPTGKIASGTTPAPTYEVEGSPALGELVFLGWKEQRDAGGTLYGLPPSPAIGAGRRVDASSGVTDWRSGLFVKVPAGSKVLPIVSPHKAATKTAGTRGRGDFYEFDEALAAYDRRRAA